MLRNGYLTEEQISKYREFIPMGREALSEEIAYAAVYLLSVASKYVTGSEIVIDGGVTLV